jgi:hypothetical protein
LNEWDYSVDLTARLNAGDSVVSLDVLSVSPDDLPVVYAGGWDALAVFWIGRGGTPGITYFLEFLARTAQGRTVDVEVTIAVPSLGQNAAPATVQVVTVPVSSLTAFLAQIAQQATPQLSFVMGSTLATGEQATVQQAGPPEAPVVTLNLPAGPVGSQGPQGTPGATPQQVLAAAVAVAPIVVDTAVSLTAAAHGGQTLLLEPGAALSLTWSQTGDGFQCLILNDSGTPIVPVLVGFSLSVPVNGGGAVAIPSPGAASLICTTADGGTTTKCWLVGDTAS